MTNGIPHRGIPFFVADDVRYNFSVYDVVRKGMPTSMRQGFDNEKYIELQAANIRKRIAQFGGKLYLEFGGKLFDDYHASRVLPGFEPDTKFRMLESLVDDVEIVIAINANHIEKGKTRGDLGIPYDEDVLRLIDVFRVPRLPRRLRRAHPIRQPARRRRLPRTASSNSASPAACTTRSPDTRTTSNASFQTTDYGKNEYIETTRPLVVVTAPGPGSGKLATCLSAALPRAPARHRRPAMPNMRRSPSGIFRSTHPVNIAYEAATVDLDDANIIDPFHLEAYGETTVNYNRDVEAFPVLKAMMERIMGESPYQSPTDMGVNMAGLRHRGRRGLPRCRASWKSCAATSPPPCT